MVNGSGDPEMPGGAMSAATVETKLASSAAAAAAKTARTPAHADAAMRQRIGQWFDTAARVSMREPPADHGVFFAKSAMACIAALSARSGPEASPMPIPPAPPSRRRHRSSWKSTAGRPGRNISVKDLTSSVIRERAGSEIIRKSAGAGQIVTQAFHGLARPDHNKNSEPGQSLMQR